MREDRRAETPLCGETRYEEAQSQYIPPACHGDTHVGKYFLLKGGLGAGAALASLSHWERVVKPWQLAA